eukprot:TRINITY_DN23953_c0_g1_i1.p1 TRINITY_DN23953_c0_g1~~TRINITY_DN23953_c0_g1_i1.p1  ORF type:complete len:413 (-),score=56.16 TRINITY_DN23953_c0_g1_i1:110-1348(-)
MGERFDYNVVLDDVDPASATVFQNAFTSLRNAFASVTLERNRLLVECKRLGAQNQELRLENDRLIAENRSQRSLSAHGGSGVGRNMGVGDRAQQLAEISVNSKVFVHQESLTLHGAPVHSVTAAKRDGLIATASWDATVHLYNAGDQKVVRTFGADRSMGGLYSVAVSKTNPSLLGCTSSDKHVYLWDPDSGERKNKLVGHKEEVNSLDFHATQQVICSGSDDNTVIIWDFDQGLMLRTIGDHDKAVYGVKFLGEQNEFLVASCSFDRKVRVFDMREKQLISELCGHGDHVIGLDFSSSQQLLASSSDDGKIITWDFRKMVPLQTINARVGGSSAENEVKRIEFSPDGNYLAAGCSDGCALIYDVNTSSNVAVLGAQKECVFDVAWSVCPKTHRRMLVTASHDCTSTVYVEN